MFCDSHAHLDADSFDADRDEVIARARAAGLTRIISVGAGIAAGRAAIKLAEAYPDLIQPTVGVDPHSAKDMDEPMRAELRKLAAHPLIVAVGETGLDYFHDLSPRDVQQREYRWQVELSIEEKLPLIVHCRDAWDDNFAILNDYARDGLRGVAHCFTGGPDEAERFMELGFLISFSGIVTFKNAKAVQAAAEAVPLEGMLIETDSPYLAPIPKRGKRNEPAYLTYVAEKIAEIKGVAVEEVGRVTGQNAAGLFVRGAA
jgi:TatD DNase family protein